MQPSQEMKTHHVKICRGANGPGCSFGLEVATDFAARIEAHVEQSGWPEFLQRTHGERLNRHHGFQIHVTACPNGCSRPHIADLGFIRACQPLLDAESCTSCGDCAEKCPDNAITMVDGLPVIDRDNCIDCGKCSLVCPVEAMGCKRTGWRVLAGGRLGRHPELARELEPWVDHDGALAVIDRALQLFMKHYAAGKRFGRILDDIGYDALLRDGD